MPEVLDLIRGKLVVSCQASPGDPLEHTDTIRRIARAVVGGGASGLRINSPEHIAAIRKDTDLPIIGIQKKYLEGKLRITPDFASAAELAAAGASIIALDCTNHSWPMREPWQESISRIHTELKLLVMADIATEAEGLAAAAAGADLIGMTLNGYTEETRNNHGFSWPLLRALVDKTGLPIIAEGHIATPEEASRAILNGAWSVVVGSAITRPGTITARFVKQMNRGTGSGFAIGVDLGGTAIKAGMVNRAGEVSLVQRLPTRATEGRAAIAANLGEAVERVLNAASDQGIHPDGLGIASAGTIDTRNGSVLAATDNLPGWDGFDLRGFAQERFHLPTQVNNDAHAAVLAELHFGAGRSLSNFAAITLGTGVGGGIVADGKLLRGHLGFAGSVGHHTIRWDGRPCNCGRRGCLEAYVSTAALVREYREIRPMTLPWPASDEVEAVRAISQLAAAADAHARKAYSVLAGYLAEGAANLFNLFDPEVIFLSGGLVDGQTHFPAEVEERVTQLLHSGAKRQPRIQLSTAGQYAGLQGAGASVFEAEDAAK